MNLTAVINSVYKVVRPELAVFGILLVVQGALIAFYENINRAHRYLYLLNSLTLVLTLALVHLNVPLERNARILLYVAALAAVIAGVYMYVKKSE